MVFLKRSIILGFSLIVHYTLLQQKLIKTKTPNLATQKSSIRVRLKAASQNLAKKAVRRKKVKNKKKLKLSQLGIGDAPIAETAFIGKFGDGNRDRAFGKTENGSLLYNLYEHIGSYIRYPLLFERNGITGAVTARVVFDNQGKYRADLSKVNSSSGYLVVLIRRMLKKCFKSELIYKSPRNQHFFILDLAISFSLPGEFEQEQIEASRYINGHFFSYALQRDISLPFKGTSTADDINNPLSVGVMLDLTAMGKSGGEEQDKKLLRQYREDSYFR